MCLQIGCVDEELPPWLMLGDCLEKMKEIPDGIVDMILADLPYGTTACSWDVVIPFEPLWEQYWRILKRDAAILLFSAQPFTTKLISSQIQLYRYSWVWKKEKGTNFMSAKLMPLLKTEDINVFSRASSNCRSKNLIPYYPQNLVRIDKYLTNCKSVGGQLAKDRCAIFNAGEEYIQEFFRIPK
jgi:site-specific DNA-methyltransferase (adenine-specific)